MGKVTFVSAAGDRHEVDGVSGQSLMALATANRINGIIGECGGNLSCASCHVYLPSEWAGKVPPPTPQESMMVDCALDVTDESRLSCQIAYTEALDGVEVRMPVSQY